MRSIIDTSLQTFRAKDMLSSVMFDTADIESYRSLVLKFSSL